jgi:hypothetical protein
METNQIFVICNDFVGVVMHPKDFLKIENQKCHFLGNKSSI